MGRRAAVQPDDAAPGAEGDALAAAGAKTVVDDGVIVYHLDGAGFTAPLALAAADAAVFAHLDGFFGVKVTGTDDLHRTGGVKDLDQVVGTGLGASAAAGALLPVHHGHAVFNMEGVKLADGHAVPQSETAGGAGFLAIVEHVGGGAGQRAPVIVLVGDGAADTVAADGGLQHGHLPYFHAHDSADALGSGGTAGDTGGEGGAIFHHGLGVGVAACIAAGAAVGAGKGLPDLGNPLILLHGKDQGEHRQEHACQQCQQGKEQNGDENLHTVFLLSAEKIFHQPAEAHEGGCHDAGGHQCGAQG